MRSNTEILCHVVLAQSIANYLSDYSYTTLMIYGANCNAHCVWTCFIRIECEFAKFAFNAQEHSNFMGCLEPQHTKSTLYDHISGKVKHSDKSGPSNCCQLLNKKNFQVF